MPSRRSLRAFGVGVLLAVAGWGSAEAQSTGEMSRHAVEAWRKYTDCQLSRQYDPCFDRISTEARRIWGEQGGKSAAQYAERKASEGLWFRRFQLVDVKIEGQRAVLTARVQGGGETGVFVERLEYLLVHEDGSWKIDAIREKSTLYLP